MPDGTKVALRGEYQIAVDGLGSGITDGTEYNFTQNDVVYMKGIPSSDSSSVSLSGTHVASRLSTLTIDKIRAITTMVFQYITDGEYYFLASNSDNTVSVTTAQEDTATSWSVYDVGYGTKKIDGQDRNGYAIYSDKQKAYLAFSNGAWVLQSVPACVWFIDITKRGMTSELEQDFSLSHAGFPISISPYAYDRRRVRYVWNDSTNKNVVRLKGKAFQSDPISYDIIQVQSPSWGVAHGVALRQSIDNGLYLGEENGSTIFSNSINEKTILELKIVDNPHYSNGVSLYDGYITKPHSNIYMHDIDYTGHPKFTKYYIWRGDYEPDYRIQCTITYEIDQRYKIELNGNYAVVSAASPSGKPCIVNTQNRKTYPDNTSIDSQPLTIRTLNSFSNATGATDFWTLTGCGDGSSMICSPFVFDSIKWVVNRKPYNDTPQFFYSGKTNAYGASSYNNGVVIHYEKTNSDGTPLYSIRLWSDITKAATIDGSGDLADGQQISIQEYTGSDRQLWYFRKSDDKLSKFPYRFRSFLDTESVLGVSGSSVSYGAIINNASPNDTDNGTRIIPATIQDSTSNRFILAHSGEGIDDLGHGTEENGSNICQWGVDPSDTGNQTWEYRTQEYSLQPSSIEIGGYRYQSARVFNWRSGNAMKLIDPSAGGTTLSNSPAMWEVRNDANAKAQYIVATPDYIYDATMPVASNIALINEDDNGTIHDEQTISVRYPEATTFGIAFASNDYNTGWTVAAEYRDVMNDGTTSEWVPIAINSYVETLGQTTYKEPNWGMAWTANVSPTISDNRIITQAKFKLYGGSIGYGDITYIVAKQLRVRVRSIAPSTTLPLSTDHSGKQYFDYLPTCGNTASNIFTIVSDLSIDFTYFEAGADGLKIVYDTSTIPSGFTLSITSIHTRSGNIKVHASEYNMPTRGTMAIDWSALEDTIPFGSDWPNNEITGFAYKIEYEGVSKEGTHYLGQSKFALSANTYTNSLPEGFVLNTDAHALSAYLSVYNSVISGVEPVYAYRPGTSSWVTQSIDRVKYVYRVKFADRYRLVTSFQGRISPQRTQEADSGAWTPSNIEPEHAMCFIFWHDGNIDVVEPPTAGALITPPRISVSTFDFTDDDNQYHELHLIGNVGYTDEIDLDATEVHGSGSKFSDVYYGGGSTHQIQISGIIGTNQPLTSDPFEANVDDLNKLLYNRHAIYRTPFGGWHAVKVTGIEYGRDGARYSKVTVKMTEVDPGEIPY